MRRGLLCVNLICKDEEHVIVRCLRSVFPIVDSYCVVDTGSTDRTRQVVREVCAVPSMLAGDVVDRPWVDFGTNKTEAMVLAREVADWALLMDADDLCSIDLGAPEKVRELLSSTNYDAFGLRVGYGPSSYERIHVVRTSLPWRYVGVRHEYIDCGVPALVGGHLPGVRYEVAGGGARSRDPEKYLRDAEALLVDLDRDPGNPRTVFYIAQSYRDAGRSREALVWYRKRARMRAWAEETMHAELEAAKLGAELGEPEKEVLRALDRAASLSPKRAEPHFNKACYLQKLGRLGEARAAAQEASERPRPESERLVLVEDVYRWRAALLSADLALMTGDEAAARSGYVALLERGDLPHEHAVRLRRALGALAPLVNASVQPVEPAVRSVKMCAQAVAVAADWLARLDVEEWVGTRWDDFRVAHEVASHGERSYRCPAGLGVWPEEDGRSSAPGMLVREVLEPAGAGWRTIVSGALARFGKRLCFQASEAWSEGGRGAELEATLDGCVAHRVSVVDDASGAREVLWLVEGDPELSDRFGSDGFEPLRGPGFRLPLGYEGVAVQRVVHGTETAVSSAFKEVQRHVVRGLTELGIRAMPLAARAKASPAGWLTVLLGAHLLPDGEPWPEPGSIVYNFEQHSTWLFDRTVEVVKKGGYRVWDYNEDNVVEWYRRGIEALYVPPGRARSLLPEWAPAEPTGEIDVLFFGSPCPRRARLQYAIEQRGLRVVSRHGVYGAGRDALVPQARVLLTSHYYAPPGLFDATRVLHGMALGACVVAEWGPGSDRFAAGCSVARYEEIADRCVELCADKALRARVAERGAALVRSPALSQAASMRRAIGLLRPVVAA